MKKINKKSMFFIAKSLISLCVTVALLFFLPTVHVFVGDNASFLYEAFIGKKSKYQGIIEIWNIDTFEAGSGSKISFLEARAKEFEKKNKGLYFLIRNMTEQECVTLLESGESPDLFSCSYGVASKIKDNSTPFDEKDYLIAENLLSAGKLNNEQYALAWCRGAYTLISTSENLKKAKVENIQDFDLVQNSLNLGYLTEGKKKTYTTYSLAFGEPKYLMPKTALDAYNVTMLESSSKLAFDENIARGSTYNAYCSFVAGESVILLGTQRDIFRMQNRLSLGKVDDLIFEPLTRYCDLVQFLMLSKNTSGDRLLYTKLFAEFLTGVESQEKLSEIGMFAVSDDVKCGYEKGVMFDIVSVKIKDYTIPKLF